MTLVRNELKYTPTDLKPPEDGMTEVHSIMVKTERSDYEIVNMYVPPRDAARCGVLTSCPVAPM